jgi:uncharacterized membrane protein HdeD (DUF308 family)
MAVLSRNWWAIALRGVAAIAFGVLTVALPDVTLYALVLLFAAFAVIDGVFTLVAAVFRHSGGEAWWELFAEGLVSIAAGVVTWVWPALTALILVYLVAVWAFATGVFAIIAAVRLRKHITGEWWLALSGVVSIAFGIALMVVPGAGALALALWIGAYSIAFGALLLALAFRLRGLQDGTPAPVSRAA